MVSQSVSYWSSTYPLPILPNLEKEIQCDVAIIGAGIGGLMCAYLLLKEGKTVAVLDQGSLAGGQTCRTTGHLAYFLDDHFYELENLFGLSGLKAAIQSHKDAIQLIEHICQEEHIACDFERLDGHLFNHPSVPSDIVTAEFIAAEHAHEEVRLWESPFSFFESKQVVTVPNQAQFHPLKYIDGLYKAILKRGGHVYQGAHVVDVKGGDSCEAFTDKGIKVTAKSIIVATNSPINNRFILHTKQAAYRTYVIAAYIPKNSVPKALYYDTVDPYHYVRVYSEAERDVLIIGGEDHKTGQQTRPKRCYEKLEAWARERFSMIKKIDFAWSGQVMEPIDGLAFLGKNPLEKNIYVITGDSGNGLTHTTIGALLIRDSILERPSPYAALYDPSRKTISSLDEFAKENLNVGVQYGKWLFPEDKFNPSQIEKASGAVIQKGVEKLAVYKDEKGEIHEFSAVCPHLGCVVAWNDAEKTWDCPCHGSSFDCQGRVINGPAVSNLKKACCFSKKS